MIYSCIDIGSDTIKIVVGKIIDGIVHILGAVNTRSVGVKKGLIINKDLVIQSINLALDELESQIGFRIDKVIVAVPLYDVDVNVYNGKSYLDGEITGSDIITCFKSCVSTIDIDQEVITVFPIEFLIDGEKKTYDPKGDSGETLESKILISTIPKKNIYTYLEVLEKCGLEVIDLSFGVINDFYAVNSMDDFNKVCGAVVDIGKDKTEIAVFNKGLMINGTVLPIGSKLVDNDINYIYHLDRSTVRELKENFSYASSKYAMEDEKYEYEDLDGEKREIEQVDLSKVVEARLEEILKNVKKSLNDLTNHKISYIIITGGVANSPGFDYLLEEIFGEITHIVNTNLIGVRNNIYTSCVGMIKYYYDKLKLRGIDYTMYDDSNFQDVEKKKKLHEKIIDDMKKYLENN